MRHDTTRHDTTRQKIIALSADYQYAEHTLTTIKSICYHNKDIDFYLFNNSFPNEWFEILNKHISQLNCQIYDVKTHHNNLKNYRTFSHITEAAFYRYFIPQFISHHKVLYLDCDLVVNGCLDDLFDTNLQDYFVAAVTDPIAKYQHNIDEFNSGVMLINNQLWQQSNITEQCLSLSNQLGNKLKNGDQEVLNILLKDKCLYLNCSYNYQVGIDYILHTLNQSHLIENIGDVIPYIVHYSTMAKPWLPKQYTRFRHLYWFYYQLSWQDIIKNHQKFS
ncbi:glycosyltransferase family 8 protein [Moraxella oblonga]|uniref:glycosyltransferase family 8 protein n=1 Tax=Moraxella oblonga TaxID=200413 RepID=UPI00082BCCC7|nr:glycosyltransferase family 8 protein [Moraxella oblonga]